MYRTLKIVGALLIVVAAVGSPAAQSDRVWRNFPQPNSRPRPVVLPVPEPAEPDHRFEIRVTVVDAAPAKARAVTLTLTRTSNLDEQHTGLLVLGRAVQIAPGVMLRVAQDKTGTRIANAGRLTARPHLTTACAEAVEILFVQPGHADLHADLTYVNGDTRLIGSIPLSGGRVRLVYATVFFPPS